MSASTGEKIFVTVIFIVLGLPPGLCAMWGIHATAFSLFDSVGMVLLFGVPSLIGLAICGGLLWLLIWTWWRRSP